MLRRLVALALLAAVLALAASCGDDAEPEPTARRVSPPPPPPAPVVQATPTPTPTAPCVDPIPIVSVNADPGGSGQYRFDPPAVYTFKVGDCVTFTLSAETEFHTFTVDDLGIDVEIDPGETETLTYIFDRPGEFKLICIPHELQGMTGSITVQ